MPDKRQAQELAAKLDAWAKKTLPEEQQTLLHWLLSRGAYTEERLDDGRIEGTAEYVFARDIKQAVMDALEPVLTHLPDPIEGWPRFSPSPSWLRGDSWPRDGYWALGLGRPPKPGNMPPNEPPVPSV